MSVVLLASVLIFVRQVNGEVPLKHPGYTKAMHSTKADKVYERIDFGPYERLSFEIFQKAYTGFLNLRKEGKVRVDKSILSICDFSKSANQKRLWVIDLDEGRVLFNSLVAHGQGSGEEYTVQFSNKENSHQSSMGFYITDNTYSGDNGYSLRLHGVDKGYNDAAYQRAIVMHGADYVSESFIKGNNRLGRSWGCPAVPKELAQPIINAIKEQTCLYIYYPDKKYLASSVWLKQDIPTEEELIRERYFEKNRSKEPTEVASIPEQKEVAQAPQPDSQTTVQPQYMGVQLAIGGR